jgi:hypothetical protein
MEIGMADAARLDPDENFARAWIINPHRLHGGGPADRPGDYAT